MSFHREDSKWRSLYFVLILNLCAFAILRLKFFSECHL